MDPEPQAEEGHISEPFGDAAVPPSAFVEMEIVASPRPADDTSSVKPASVDAAAAAAESEDPLGWFGKLLTLWVLLAMIAGGVLGAFVPSVADWLGALSIYNVWIPGIVPVWVMVYPVMLNVNLAALRNIPKSPGGILLTCGINWAVQPFTMYGFALLFFSHAYSGILSADRQDQYIAGAVFLGTSPCTAMVFVWSYLAEGDPTYTAVQVIVNDIILLFAYVPIVVLLLGASNIYLPWGTVILSVVVYVVVPFVGGVVTRLVFVKCDAMDKMGHLLHVLKWCANVALLLTVFFVFVIQGPLLHAYWVDVLLICVPLIVQTYVVFALILSIGLAFGLRYGVLGPASFIGTSNFFELAIALAIGVYGASSGAVLVTVVGVLIEVPSMLLEVKFIRWIKGFIDRRAAATPTFAEEASRLLSRLRAG